MADVVADTEVSYYPTGFSPDRLAWGVLLISFALFCVVCAAVTIGVQWYFFESTVSLNVILQPGKGTSTIRTGSGGEGAVRLNETLSPGTIVLTDPTVERAQTTLVFRDPQSDGFIALITLKENTSVDLRNASRPRFQFGNSIFQIDLFDVLGELEVSIPQSLSRGITLNVRTAQGTWIRLGSSGRYTIFAEPGETTVMNWAGEVVMVVPDSPVSPRSIPVNQLGYFQVGTSEIQLSDAPRNLLTNSDLTIFTPDDAESDEMLSATMVGWGCTHDPPNSGPRGEHNAGISPDGRSALQLVRGDGATTSGRTGCEQTLADSETGLDVTGYSALELRISLYIENQTVGACGIVATECPLMIQIDYVTEDNALRTRTHGVYSQRNPTYPLVCDSCFQPHVLVQGNTWYLYESGNLFDLLRQPNPDPNLPPFELTAIRGIRFYASGHEYSVYVNNVSLLGWQSEETDDDIEPSTPFAG